MTNAVRSPPPMQSKNSAGKWTPTLYFLLGQVGWFACVMSAAAAVSWVGVSVVLLLLAAHLVRVPRPREELKLVAAVIVIAALWETAMIQLHLLAYPHGTAIQGAAPVWILALWGLFAAQFNTTYAWLKTRIMLAALLGAVAGPLSFRAGVALGALRFEKPLWSIVALAVGWGLLLPMIVVLSRRWDGVQRV